MSEDFEEALRDGLHQWLDDEEPSHDLWAGIESRLRGEPSYLKPIAPFRRLWARSSAYSLLTAAAVILVVALAVAGGVLNSKGQQVDVGQNRPGGGGTTTGTGPGGTTGSRTTRTPPGSTSISPACCRTFVTTPTVTDTSIPPVVTTSLPPTTQPTVPGTPPGAPAVSVTATAPDSILVHWTAPPDNGSAITGYVASLQGGTSQNLPASATSTSFTNLIPTVAYTADVTATNAGGSGAPGTASATTPAPAAVVVNGDIAGSGFSASGQGNVNYGASFACTARVAFSLDTYPPNDCEQMGGASSSTEISFSGNSNCVSAGKPFSGSEFTWAATIPYSGVWDVEVYVPYWTQGGTSALYTFPYSGGTGSAPVNQNATEGTWQTLGTVAFQGGNMYSITLTDQAPGDPYCHYDTAVSAQWVWNRHL